MVSSAAAAPLTGPNLKLPTIEISHLPEPSIPDLEPEIPDLGNLPAANPGLSVSAEPAAPPGGDWTTS